MGIAAIEQLCMPKKKFCATPTEKSKYSRLVIVGHFRQLIEEYSNHDLESTLSLFLKMILA